MKTLLIHILSILFVKSCETTIPDPQLNEIDGRWKLVKIGVGFPAPGSPSEKVPEYEEVLEFNASKQFFTRTKDGKVVERSTVSMRVDENASIKRDMIVFENTKTYSYLWFTETPRYLVLYQSAPVGARLADGNLFFYEKIK
ncbi:hypothetical protein [Emticicia fluvialis]|uniref:hypothetical protein n=1 Tax=Emticicia fluvialis TaxID=2974474 RepID=UPI002165CCFF|nr:hypothetical protein [Emticicia fluvialis]